MAKRRYRKKKKSITLNKYKIGIGLIALGGIYFFSLYLAKGSPVFKFLTQYASIAFGNIGLNVFFSLSIITGFLILSKGYLMKLLIKQSILLMIMISAIINFPVIEGTTMQYNQL
ncbi:MAG: hypothetical protein GXP45_04370 [bacterium]|nr:hypothetical protein [bacterium]